MDPRKKQELLKRQIDEKMKQAGEDKRLRDSLERMLTDCGWRDALKAQALSILNEPGNERMTVEELVARLTPEARATVPADVKATLLGEINEFIRQNA